MYLSDEAIFERFLELEFLAQKIDLILAQNYTFTDERLARTKRGELHNFISNKLNLTLNNPLCKMIRERVEANGGKAYLCEGKAYYKHLSLKGMKT